MTDTLREELGTSTGLIEACTGTIAEAWFGRQENAEGDFADRVYLFLKLINLETEDEYDEWTARLGIGNGWEPMNGGAKVVREDGGETKFSNNSDIGRLLNRVLGADGGKEGQRFAEAFEGAIEAVEANLSKIPNRDVRAGQYADIWTGLRFEFDTEQYTARNLLDDEGKPVTWTRLMPVKFVGVDDRVGGGGQGVRSASSNQGSASTDNGQVEEEFYALARECDSHGEFVQKALPKAKGDPSLLAKVADDSDDGIYAKARA